VGLMVREGQLGEVGNICASVGGEGGIVTNGGSNCAMTPF